MLEINTEKGNIRFSVNVIKRIVSEAVRSTEGKAYIFNYKGKYKSAASGFASKMNLHYGDFGEPGSIVIEDSEEGMMIAVYLVLTFGCSIKGTCRSISDYIYDHMTDMMDQAPAEIRLHVTGVESNVIARRNIEYIKKGPEEGVINEP